MPGTLTGLPQQVPQLGDVRRLALPTRLDCIQCDRDYHEDQKDGSSIAHPRTNLPQASYVSLVASVHRSFLHAPNWRAPAIDGESPGSMCDTPQARHSKV